MRYPTRVKKGGALSGLLIVLLSTRAFAEEPAHEQAALDYEVPTNELACPDRATFVSAMATRLGYDPIVLRGASTSKSLRVRYVRARKSMTAKVQFKDGESETEKVLVSETGACAELAVSAAAAAAIFVDPRAMFPKVPKAPPHPKPSPVPPPALPDPPERPEPLIVAPVIPLRWRAALAVAGCVGCAPSPNLGFELMGGVAKGRFGLDVGARADLPITTWASSAKQLRSSLVVGEINPHLRFGPARLGIVTIAGAFLGEGSGVSQSAFWAAAGVRAAFEWRLVAPLFVRFALDGVLVLSRVALRIDGSDVWSSPAVAARTSIGVGLEL